MNSFWKNYQQALQAKFDSEAYEAFIKPAAFTIENDTICISVPNSSTERWMRKNLQPVLKQLYFDSNNKSIEFSYKINPSATKKPIENESLPAHQVRQKDKCRLIQNQTFSNFIPGYANEIPLLAAKSIANRQSDINPLFLYGSTGLGKTHLIQAIGNQYRKNFPTHRVLYITARDFLTDVVQAFRLSKQEQLKNRYQNLDLLLIDDIQYIGGDKVRTQEEFFFLFNSLCEQNKYIVISCDRAPSQIEDLPQRLTTRFSAGLPAHLTLPEFELRVQIVRQKAKQRSFSLKDDVVYYIAEHVKSNVRELEGAVNRLEAMARFQQVEPTTAMCRNTMADLIGQANQRIHPDIIKEKVANYYHIRTSELSSQKRHRNIAIPRHIATYLCRQMTNMSLPEIGLHFGKRNHTTVLHSCRYIEEKIKSDPSLWDEVKRLEIIIKD